MEHFYTLQGEGHYSGQAAYFIRLAGCDVGCHWCDVKESWTQGYPLYSSEELSEFLTDIPTDLVVITGGEPLMHQLNPLCSALHNIGKKLHIETSGAGTISGEWDWFCLSPKKFKAPSAEAYQLANELKVIVYNKHDLDWAIHEAEKVGEDCLLFLQPEWSREKEMLPLIIYFIRLNPQWKVSLQTHKYMNIP